MSASGTKLPIRNVRYGRFEGVIRTLSRHRPRGRVWTRLRHWTDFGVQTVCAAVFGMVRLRGAASDCTTSVP